LPRESEARHVTDAVPRPKTEPERGVQVTATGPSTASRAETLKLTLAPFGPVAEAFTVPGKFKTGAAVSSTVTSKLRDVLLPCESVARQVTVVTPNGKTDPGRGVQVTGTMPSTASVAEATNVTTAPDLLVA
jgi:hypothetical protein